MANSFLQFFMNLRSRREQLRGQGFSFKHFLFPDTKKSLLRALLLIALAYAFFRWICLPVIISGGSMEPTYAAHGFNFCWRPAYLFSSPQKGDVVMLRMAGQEVMLLKRILAFPGETVEFRKGKLYVNGAPVDEPYVKSPCDWELSPRTVDEGKVYVIGDNRGMSIDGHKFGQTEIKRIAGKPLW